MKEYLQKTINVINNRHENFLYAHAFFKNFKIYFDVFLDYSCPLPLVPNVARSTICQYLKGT